MQKTGIFPFLPWWPPFLSWLLLLGWLSLESSPPVIEMSFFGWDKVQHAGAYAVLTFLAGMAFNAFPAGRRHSFRWAFVLALCFGGLMEVSQGLLTEARTAELGDLLADIAGAGLVYLALRNGFPGRPFGFLNHRK